jgi:predicted transposase/invertase (TIGR01784 family)
MAKQKSRKGSPVPSAEKAKTILEDSPLEMPDRRLNPLNFFLFEKLFGEKGDEPQLLAFLKPILAQTGRKLKSITIVDNKVLSPQRLDGKKGILDIRAVMQDGTRCNIVVQRQNQHNMGPRSFFYLANDYIQGIDAGENYKNLPDVICINILDFNYIPLDTFHTHFHFWEDTDKSFCLTTAAEIHFIELPKFRHMPKKDVQHDLLHRWLSYLDITTPPSQIKEIIAMDTAIARTQEVVDRVSSNKAMLHEYLRYEMALSDETSRLEDAVEDADEDTRLKVARNFLKIGSSPEQVAQGTGLPLRTIKKLQKEMVPKK